MDNQQRHDDAIATQVVEGDSKEEDGYGPWMVVSRRKTGPKRTMTENVNPTRTNQASSPSLVWPTKYAKEEQVG